MTHPGIMSILERKSTLQQLSIQSPRYLTKYSMKLLGNEMTLLTTFKYEPKYFCLKFFIWVPISFSIKVLYYLQINMERQVID